jgi:nucleoside 2-deoxyribosyltransferase
LKRIFEKTQKMHIYFACSITGGREEQSVYQVIVDTLLKDGHIVPTAHLSNEDVMALEEIVDPFEIYTRDIKWIDESSVLIAEVSTPSHGVGFEISYALSKNKSVLCLYQDGKRISKMLTGNNHPNFDLVAYKHPGQIPPIIRDFIAHLNPIKR